MDTQSIRQFMEHIRADDALFENFLSAARAGSNQAFMSTKNETLIVDDSWIYTIDGVLYNIEKIARDPRKFIAEHESIVDVERARKTTAKTVRHLASHSGNVRNIKSDGEVVPKKLLTIELDEEIAIYENRFIGTLVHRLINFVEQRKTDISEHFRMQDETGLNVKSNFKYGDAHVEYEMKVLVQAPPEDPEYLVKVKELLEKIDDIRKRLRILLATPFMRTIDKAKPVRPPIQKTNLIRMQQDYRNCYQLWLYISSYTAVGYSIEIKDKTLPVDGDYFDDLTVLTTLSVKSMVENNLLNKAAYDAIEYSEPRRKNYKSMTKYDFEAQFKYDKEAAQVEESINEYYYQQMKRAFAREAHRPMTDDPALQEKELKTSFMRYFNTVAKINNEIYLDLIRKQSPTAVGRTPLQKRQAEMERQQVMLKRLHQLTTLKAQDLERTAKLEKRELLKMDQIKAQIEKERQKIEKAKLAAQKEKERIAKAKERAKKIKEAEKAKKIAAAAKAAEQKRKAKLAERKEKEKAAAAKSKAKDPSKNGAERNKGLPTVPEKRQTPPVAEALEKAAKDAVSTREQESVANDRGKVVKESSEPAAVQIQADSVAQAASDQNSDFLQAQSDIDALLSEAAAYVPDREEDANSVVTEQDAFSRSPDARETEASIEESTATDASETSETADEQVAVDAQTAADSKAKESQAAPLPKIDFSELEAEYETRIYSPMEDFEQSGDKRTEK